MCPSDRQLLDLLGGNLDEVAAGAVHDHIEGCASCRLRAQAVRDVWTALGEWEPNVPDVDMAGRVRAVVLREFGDAREASTWRWKLAASIMLAVGAGAAVGGMVRLPARETASAPAISDVEVAESLGLDAWGGDAPGLAGNLAELPADSDEAPLAGREETL